MLAFLYIAGGIVSAILYWRRFTREKVILYATTGDLPAARGEIWVTFVAGAVWPLLLAQAGVLAVLFAIRPQVLGDWLNRKTAGALPWLLDIIIRNTMKKGDERCR